MNIFRYLRSSFSAQLSLWVTGFVTVIFVVALTLLFRFSLSVVKDESLEQNMQVLEHAALRVDLEADRQIIFRQFAKVDLFTEGVGLGLPLSKRAANRIGGDLVLDPESQGGASFILTIPISK